MPTPKGSKDLNQGLIRFTKLFASKRAAKFGVFFLVCGTSLFCLPQSASAVCINTAQAATIAATAEPTAQGETPTVTTINTCGGDDVSYQVPVTTSVTYDGVQYDRVYATTNSVITFGQPDGTYWTYPSTPSISIASIDWVVYPNQRNDEHLVISSSDGGFQVDLSARPIWNQTTTVNPTNIVVTAAINTNGTVAISYVISGPDWSQYNPRTGARLNDGTVVPLEQANIQQVQQAPVLTPEPVQPTPTPSPTPIVDPSPTATASAVPSSSPTIEPSPTPSPTPTQELSPSPSPTPTLEPSPSPTPTQEPITPTPAPTVTQEPAPAPAPEPAPAPRPAPIIIPDPAPVVAPEPPAVEPEPTEPPIEEALPPIEEQPPLAEPQAPVEEVAEIPAVIEPPLETESAQELPIQEQENQLQESSQSPIKEPPVEEPPTQSTPTPAPSYENPVAIGSVDLSTLAPDTPVELENGVILTAEVVVALELLGNPADLIGAIFTDPGQALMALGNIGADMSPEVREKSEKVVVSAIIAGGIATNAAAMAGASYRRKP